VAGMMKYLEPTGLSEFQKRKSAEWSFYRDYMIAHKVIGEVGIFELRSYALIAKATCKT